MNEKRALSWNEFINSGFDGEPYKFIDEEGTFDATVDMKRWGKKADSMMAYFTLDDGRKIIAFSWKNSDYLGLGEISVGSAVTLTFSKNSKGYIYLKSVE